MADAREQVAIYRQCGWYCVPLRPRSKSPSRRDWTKLRLKPEAFPENSNIGIILGEPSGWIVDVDLDCPEAIGPRRGTSRVVFGLQNRERPLGFDAETMNESGRGGEGLRVTAAARNRWRHGVQVGNGSGFDIVARVA